MAATTSPAQSLDPEAFYDLLRAGPRLPRLKPPGRPVPLQGHFSTVLRSTIERLNAGDASVGEYFAHVHDEFAALFDGYPKGQVHLLAVPRRLMDSARDLSAEDLPMLRRLAAYTAWLQEEVSEQHPALTFRHGVHSKPSLVHLHVHVLSQDFLSPCVKNKKHYNSFRPPFLVGLDDLISNLQRTGRAMGDITLAQAEAWLKEDLRCSACGEHFGSRFAELKRHLAGCRPPASAPPPSLFRAAADGDTARPPAAARAEATGEVISVDGGPAHTDAGAGVVRDLPQGGPPYDAARGLPDTAKRPRVGKDVIDLLLDDSDG